MSTYLSTGWIHGTKTLKMKITRLTTSSKCNGFWSPGVLTVFQCVLMQMSHTKSSHGTKNPGAGVCETTEEDSAGRKTTFMTAELNVRRRVSKEVGLTSYTFIGPAFPPPTAKVKSDIEDTLSEFYKELEKIDTPDAASPQPPVPLKKPTRKEKISQDVSEAKLVQSVETDGYQRSSGQRQPSRQHWYQNEPYNPRRPRPGMELSSGRAAPTQNQWHHPQTLNGPPNPRFQRPPFLPPPPPPAFPNPHPPNLPSHVNQNWSGSSLTNQYQEEPHFPAFPNFPPPNVCSRPPPDFHRDSAHHFDKDERVRTHDAHSDCENIGWSRDGGEERCQSGEDYDRHQRYDPENEQWENPCQRPDNPDVHRSSLVLILMRGLPGSGKSTLARYVYVWNCEKVQFCNKRLFSLSIHLSFD